MGILALDCSVMGQIGGSWTRLERVFSAADYTSKSGAGQKPAQPVVVLGAKLAGRAPTPGDSAAWEPPLLSFAPETKLGHRPALSSSAHRSLSC